MTEEPAEPTNPPTAPRGPHRFFQLFLGLVLGAAAVGVFFYTRGPKPSPVSELPPGTRYPSPATTTQTPPPEETATETPPTEVAKPFDQFAACAAPMPKPQSRSGLFEWQAPKLGGPLGLYSDPQAEAGSAVYRIATVKKDPFPGGDLYLVVPYCDGICIGGDYLYVVQFSGRLTVLEKQSNAPGYGWTYASGVKTDPDFTIDDLVFPANLAGEGGKYQLARVDRVGFFRERPFCATDYRPAFNDQTFGTVYVDNPGGNQSFDRHGFYLLAPDGYTRTYAVEMGIVADDNVPLVTWSDGSKNRTEYEFRSVGGCGASNFRDVVSPSQVPQSDIVQIGTSVNGEPVYGYRDKNAADLRQVYDTSYFPEGQKPTYAEFVASRPIFFWRDGTGSLVRFKSKKYLPAAECAKPAIYLYPERQQTVSVSVGADLTYADPPYPRGGWTVSASPGGVITSGGRTYPYLFWEGRSRGMYERPERGWLVTRPQLPLFLAEKLTAFGLEGREVTDFTEYWLPRMQDKPYYFVTFMGTELVDRLAPLTVSPLPDTSIRVLMDFEGLDEPRAAAGFSIKTPERKGFTLVEWGGVRRPVSP